MSIQARILHELMHRGECIAVPGVFDGFSARLAVKAGARVLHASGGAISRSIGYPDTGLVTMTEMLGRIGEIVASGVPVFADADTGYGNEMNAARTACCYRAAGVAGLHVEDQTFPKRCGHLEGVAVIQASDMADKIRAMKQAAGDELVIAARTDAVKLEGLNSALDRMELYLDAGADIAFLEGIETIAHVEEVGKRLPGVPLVFNQATASCGGAISLRTLAANGVRLALYPGDLQRGAGKIMQAICASVLKTGSTVASADHMLTNAERDELLE